jgi:23S rRNA (uracil1939-C5)-methyltransferase
LIKINDTIAILNKNNIKIDYAYFQKSNHCDDYGILFSSIIPGILQQELIKDKELKVIGYLQNDNVVYLSKETKLSYCYYDFIWHSSLTSFIQINPHTSQQLHQLVSETIFKNKQYNLYCLGGEMGIYSKYFGNNYDSVKCITDCKSLYDDYLYNNHHQNNCYLVDYKKIILENIINTTNNILIVNISRKGLGELSKQILSLENGFKQIIYIGCQHDSVNNDLLILKEKYKVDRIIKLNQFPQTNHYLYFVSLF